MKETMREIIEMTGDDEGDKVKAKRDNGDDRDDKGDDKGTMETTGELRR